METAQVYRMQEAADAIGIAYRTLWNLIKSNRAHAKKRGEGKTNAWLLTADEVQRLKELYGPAVTSHSEARG